MKVITPGHRYELANFDNPDAQGQIIQFIEKVPVEPDSAILETISDGTTNEDVLTVLIDRLMFLNGKVPSRDTSLAITNLEIARFWLEKRTSDRKARGVEGRNSL